MGNISAPVIKEDTSAIQEDISARKKNKVRVKTMHISEPINGEKYCI
jgi:hypothetical protein